MTSNSYSKSLDKIQIRLLSWKILVGMQQFMFMNSAQLTKRASQKFFFNELKNIFIKDYRMLLTVTL